MPDTEPPASNGLTQLFSKNRSKKNRDSASNSTKSTGTDSDGLGMRGSLESVIQKLKTHGDQDDGEVGSNDNASPSSLKKLVPKGIGSKRRQRKQEQEEEQRLFEEAARGRSIADRGTLENETPSPISRNDSGHSGHSGDGGSSLITSDSETDS
jgi:hypothetical protein